MKHSIWHVSRALAMLTAWMWFTFEVLLVLYKVPFHICYIIEATLLMWRREGVLRPPLGKWKLESKERGMANMNGPYVFMYMTGLGCGLGHFCQDSGVHPILVLSLHFSGCSSLPASREAGPEGLAVVFCQRVWRSPPSSHLHCSSVSHLGSALREDK